MIPVKINGTGGIDAVKAYSAQQRKADAKNKAVGQDRGDTLEISPEARRVQVYKGLLDGIPAVREDLVASLKKQVADGTYQPDSKKIASGILQESIMDKAGQKG